MVSAGGQPDLVIDDLVDQPVLFCDAPRPVPLECVLEWLGLADPFVSVAGDAELRTARGSHDIGLI